MNYFETVGGHELLERCNHSLPKIIKAFEKIANELEMSNKLKAQELIAKGVLDTDQYRNMRESQNPK